MKYSVYIGEEELTDYVIIPLSEQLALDDSLDQGYLQLRFTSKENAFKPFTEARIVIKDKFNHTRELNFFVASDQKTEVISNGTFSHDLLLIEQSKWFERFLTGTKTITNPLVHDYAGVAGDVCVEEHREIFLPYVQTIETTAYRYRNDYKSVINIEEEPILEVKSAKDFYNESTEGVLSVTGYLKITKNGETTQYQYNESTTLDFRDLRLGEGTYYFEYYIYVITTYDRSYKITSKFNITVMSQAGEKPNKTITDAVNSLLATIETIRASETPRFVFNSEQATKYSAIDSPEFTLTGTLWEALRQIGTYIHAIPRLRGDFVYFDELGGDEKVANKLTDYISNTEQFDIEQFASAIDSTIQNVVNLDDIDEGSIIDPYKVGFKTPRTETGAVYMDDKNAFIQTKKPIGRIVKVEVGYLNDYIAYSDYSSFSSVDDYVGYYVIYGNSYTLVNEINKSSLGIIAGATIAYLQQTLGDITPYIYEKAEYDALSSYGDEFPRSKNFALKYTIGQKNITELSFKAENAISPIFSGYAIANIINRVAGRSVTISDIRELQFRVTYIPITTTRARQVKPYTQDLEFDSTLAYNQSAQKISSKAYGEAMKGAIARLGNPQITKVFVLNDLSLIPNAGQLYDDEYYVSVVKCEYYGDFFKCSVGLSKDFNKLNEYVGINSEQRFYEISEKQAEDRYVIYEDYCVLGKREDIIYNGESLLVDYSNFRSGNTQVKVVEVQGDNSNKVRLPITSYSLGNSMIFTFDYDDNYSAGEEVYVVNSSTIQNQVSYTDIYGEIQYLHIEFGDVKLNNRILTQPGLENFNISVEKGRTLPLIPDTTIEIYNPLTQQMIQVPDENFSVVMTTGTDDIRLEKDNREKITFTYQMHFVSTDKNIVIGNIAKYNSLFMQGGGQYQNDLYILQNKIGKFDKFIDTTTATRVDPGLVYYTSVTQNNESIGFGFALRSVPVSGKAWAVVRNGELVFGSNESIEASNSEKELTTFVFTRKVN